MPKTIALKLTVYQPAIMAGAAAQQRHRELSLPGADMITVEDLQTANSTTPPTRGEHMSSEPVHR
jgi:hypothetical protein